MEELKDPSQADPREDQGQSLSDPLNVDLLFTTQHYLKRYSKCPACDSHLHFSHLTDFIRNLTVETANCPECGLRVRRAAHRLQ
ncbi:MAG: hypothetical protein HYX41_07695 [Bdellovibrio sp.]|nr:hypothetical protein [Bdellovibrio sp.]